MFMKQNQKAVNVNKPSLFEELLGIQSVLSIAVYGSTVALQSLCAVDTKKGNFFNPNKINLFSFKQKTAGATLPTADWSHKNRPISLPPDRSLPGGEGVGRWMWP